MALGDVTYIGWSGSPLTKELTPRLNWLPKYAADGTQADTIIKQLVRYIMCFDRDKQTVVQALQAESALSLPTISAAGAEQSTSFSGRWKLTRIDDGKAATGISLLTVTYEQEASSLFEFNLPTGVTLTCSSGVVTLAYNGTTLTTWDSGTGACSEGVQLVSDKTGSDALRHLFNLQTPPPYLTYTITVNGVRMSSHQVYAADMADAVSRRYDEVTVGSRITRDTGTYTADGDGNLTANGDAYTNPEYTDDELEALRVAAGADGITARTTFSSRSQDVRGPDSVAYVASYNRQIITQHAVAFRIGGVPPAEYGAYERYYASGITVRERVYLTGKNLSPAWELNTSDNYLRIHVAGATIMQWDITGL